MRFEAKGCDGTDGPLIGRAYHGDERGAAFCALYRTAISTFVETGSMRLEPAVLASDHFGKQGHRTVQDVSAQPFLAQAVFDLLDVDLGEFDRVTLIPPKILSGPKFPPSAGEMAAIAISDVSAALAPECRSPGFLWADLEVGRLSVAAVLVRASSAAGLPVAAEPSYAEACAAASARLLEEGNYLGENGEALLVGENPGLVTLLQSLVDAVRAMPPLPLPANASDILRDADAAVSVARGLVAVSMSNVSAPSHAW